MSSTPAVRRERMALALEALAASDRLVLALELCEGLAPVEIAAALQMPARQVARRREVAFTALSRALAGRPVRRVEPAVVALRSAM